MKLVDICSIIVESDELKRGWYKGDEQTGDEQSVTTENIKLDFNIYQETINSPTRYYRDSPPESETYVGDVTKVVINNLVYVESGFDIPDLDYSIDYRDIQNPKIIADFLDHVYEAATGFDTEDKKIAEKVLNYIKSKPEILKTLFNQIDAECEDVYKGEI